MGFLDWVMGVKKPSTVDLVNAVSEQVRILLAHNETMDRLMPSDQVSHDLKFFQDLKKMLLTLQSDLAEGASITEADVANLRTLYTQFAQTITSIDEGLRIVREQLGIPRSR